MNHSTKRNRLFGLKKLFSLQVIVVLFASLIVASASPFQERWELGRYQLLNTPRSGPDRVLRASMGARGLTFGFLRRVGGMAFEQTAKPAAGLAGKPIKLGYDKKRVDGYRLAISVGNRYYYPELADWMLIPIAKYANTEFTAIVSLTDPDAEIGVREIVYHPDLKDTLLGLRLLQADMLLIDPENMWPLPRRGGETAMGKGESLPDETDSLKAASEIASFMHEAEAKEFESWLITDMGVDITFSTSGNNFRLAGDFYHYFWRIDPGEEYRKYEEQFDALYDRAEALELQGKTEEADKLYEQAYNLEEPAFSEAYRKYVEQSDALYDRAKALKSQGKTEEANKLYKQIAELDRPVIGVRAITDSLKNKRKMLRQVNPPLYEAVNKTMRYAALFRYVKAHNPQSWKAFYAQVATQVPEPDVTTPNAWKANSSN
jgi:tetratricopeptide (TPR) repeat protein